MNDSVPLRDLHILTLKTIKTENLLKIQTPDKAVI